MIIADNRIKAAGCILPVAQNANLPKDMGLRHRSGWECRSKRMHW